MTEISFDNTDYPQINIAEIHDSAKYQREHKSRSQVTGKSAETRRAKLVRKLYDAATATTQHLAVSVTVFTKKGSTVTFWAHQKSPKGAAAAHDLMVQLEDVQVEQATELS